MDMQLKLTPTTNDVKSNGFSPGLDIDISPLADMMAQPQPSKLQPVAEPAKAPEHLKIAIVGTAPSSRSLAPVNDPSWKIWACSAGNQGMLSRVDAWFEIHSNLMWPEHEHFGKPYLDWLNQQSFPVYMQDNTLVPRAIPLPKEELVEEFGDFFFTSSFAWMIAFAIKQGASEIGLWGVDMASKDEYILQRSGGQFFIREAVLRGITVHIPKESDLGQRPPLYGFDDSTNFMRKICVREKELRDRLTPMKQQREQLDKNITYLEGALEDVDYFKTVHGGVQSSGLGYHFGKPRSPTNG